MPGKRGYPHGSKPRTIAESDFDHMVQQLRLSPEQWARSKALRDWACKNKDSRYVPLDLLTVWGLTPTKHVTPVFFRRR